MEVIKKNGLREEFDFAKIKNAVNKSAERCNEKLNEEDFLKLENIINNELTNKEVVDIIFLHNLVEQSLEQVNDKVAKSYKDYRDYKKDFKGMLENVLKTADELQYHSDHSNANADSELVSTRRSLIYKALSKEL